MGATNIPWGLDPAVRRRFERRVYISLPNADARVYLLKNVMKLNKHTLTPQDFEEICLKTEGFSGSDLKILAREACFEILRRAIKSKFSKKVLINGKEMYTPSHPSEKGAI